MFTARQTLLLCSKNISDITLKNCSRGYALKSELKIKWVKPAKIPCTKPEKSGDLSGLVMPDKNLPQPAYVNCKELENADETIKRLFSLEFSPRSQSVRTYANQTASIVKQHSYDTDSIETQIAFWTATIRSLQEIQEKFPYNRRQFAALKEIIEKRNKHLKLLRRDDYKRYEWLIDKLNIVYKAPPAEYNWVVRKESMQKLTTKYCDELRNERLLKYQQELEAKQPEFLEEKIRTLEYLRKEQEECGVEITVQQDEIDEARKKLEQLQNKSKS